MISVCCTMGPELDDKSRSTSTMEAPVNKENGTVVKEIESKHLTCVSNYEDCTFEMDIPLVEKAVERRGDEDGEVDIVDTTHSGCDELVEEKCQETTECSSSFDNVSGVENGAAVSDAEVVSDFREDATSALALDGYDEVSRMRTREKRLTSHWRTFIRPLVWRCKWVELQVKKLKFQGHRFDSELAEYNRTEQIQVDNLMTDFSTKSIPFSGGSQRRKFLKRKKRRRIEDTMDVRAYMSQHNLFSYHGRKLCPTFFLLHNVLYFFIYDLNRWYVAENGKATGDGASLDDEWDNVEKINYNDEIGLDNELLWLESRDGDESVEQMLRKIGTLQGQVCQLRTRIDKVISDNAGKFSYVDNTSFLRPCNALMSAARNPVCPSNNGNRMAAGSSYIASQLISQYTVGDGVLPESAVSSHGEVTHLPDIIESTNQSHLGVICHTEDDILIYNERVKEEMNNFEEVKIQPMEKAQAPKERQENTVPPACVDPDPPAGNQPAPKIRSISKLTAPKSKRRKGRRKSASGRRRRS